MPPNYTFPGPVPREALQYFESKGLTVGFDWHDVWAKEHSASFTAAKILELGVLATVRGMVDRALEKGTTFEQWRKEVKPLLDQAGWSQYSKTEKHEKHRMRVIFDTNMRTARAAGQWQRIERTRRLLPYLIYSIGPAIKHTPTCLSWDGTTLPADDPWWNDHFPPNHYLCHPGGTQIATADGWKSIESIRSGDLILGGSGDLKPVRAIYPKRFDGKLVRLSTKNGSVAATPNHRFLTQRGWIRADGLKIGDVLVQLREAASLQPSVGNIDQSKTCVDDIRMPAPFTESTRPEAFDSKTQLRNKNINPVTQDVLVVNASQSESAKMAQQNQLAFSGFDFRIRMMSRIQNIASLLREGLLLSRCFCLRWMRAGFEHLGCLTQPITSLFRYTESRVRFAGSSALIHESDELFGGSFPSVWIAFPLQSNNLTTRTPFDSKIPHPISQGSDVDTPKVGDILSRHTFIDVPEPEGFTDGAPLNRFDSLDEFVRWSRSHAVLSIVDQISTEPFRGLVYDLNVSQDRSFCTSICVSHNCTGTVRQAGEREVEKRGGVSDRPDSYDVNWKLPDGREVTAPVGVHPSFAYNFGKNRTGGLEDALRTAEGK